MAFNRPLPAELAGDKEGKWFPCSAVLPMGFKSSVGLAQHVHRFIMKQALLKSTEVGMEESSGRTKVIPALPLYIVSTLTTLTSFESFLRLV